jgi:hypothetical protein
MKKYIFVALFLVALLVTPVLAQTSVAEQIAALRAQIQELQTRLTALLQQNRGDFCWNFNRDLRPGDGQSDWTKLESVLEFENVASVKELQEKYADEVLRPHGLRLGTGFVGPSTRALLNRLYACRPTNQAPVISGVSGPASLKVGETGTWTIRASDPNNGALTYSVVWSDGFSATPMSPGESGLPAASGYVQNATFSHAFNRQGDFAPQFFVRNQAGQMSSASLSVRVSDQAVSPITLTSPNGGERWEAGSAETITWKFASTRNRPNVDIYLEAEPPGCASEPTPCVLDFVAERFLLDRNIAGTRYGWVVATEIDRYDLSIPPAPYRIEVCAAGTTNCDRSDRAFTITDPAPTVISVTSPNGDETWAQGSRQTISWRGASRTPTSVYLVSYSANEACRKAGGEICPQDIGQIYLITRSNTTRSNYSWTTDATPGRYWVRVCQANVCDDSDRTFTITE